MSGLKPVRHQSGAPYNGAATRYFIPATDTAAMFIGDPVTLAGSADPLGIHPTVVLATLAAGNNVLGPIVAVENSSPELGTVQNDENKHRLASTATYVWVADDPDLIFEVHEDAAGAAIAAADVGNHGILVTGTGETVYGSSGYLLDSSDVAANTATAQYKLLGMSSRVDNALGSGTTPAVGPFLVKIESAQHDLAT